MRQLGGTGHRKTEVPASVVCRVGDLTTGQELFPRFFVVRRWVGDNVQATARPCGEKRAPAAFAPEPTIREYPQEVLHSAIT